MVSSPYAAVHKSTQGPGDARPTAQQVVEDQGLVGKLNGKVMLITGCTSGIGVETARALYSTGAKIYITARQMAKGEAVAKELSIDATRPVEVIEMELDSFDSVKAGATDFLSRSKTLNVLVTNAGVMACPEGRTKDGFETQFGTNHLGHFLLFQLLKDTLLKSSSPSFASRVVSVSSSGHRLSGVHFGNYQLDTKDDPYDIWQAYGQSKTANIYMANEIERRYGAKGLHGLSLHPGVIMTELVRHTKEDPLMSRLSQDETFIKTTKSPEQGAATSTWAAIGTEWEGKGGRYLNDVQDAGPFDPSGDVFAPGYSAHAYDKDKETQLWKDSLQMVGLEDDQ